MVQQMAQGSVLKHRETWTEKERGRVGVKK